MFSTSSEFSRALMKWEKKDRDRRLSRDRRETATSKDTIKKTISVVSAKKERDFEIGDHIFKNKYNHERELVSHLKDNLSP